MDTDSLSRKGLAVVIILLFVGIAVAPSLQVSVVRAASDDDFVEVSSEACGIKGFGNTTVKLTREQYQNLEQYLVEFRAQLNQTTTREEAVPIFKEAIVELNKYGLLPKGMSVEEAQKLVTRDNLDKREMKFFQNICGKYKDSSSELITNYFCFVTGRANTVYYMNLITKTIIYADIALTAILGVLFILIYISDFYPHLNKLLNNIYNIIDEIWGSLINLYTQYFDYLNKQPFLFGCNIHLIGGNGWIYTIGLIGIKKINGSLYGQIPFLIKWIGNHLPYQAIKYFTGLKLHDESKGDFFIGSALQVKIGSESPE